jgi:hypothetical protein
MIREYISNQEVFVEIEVSKGEFVSMLKSTYDEMIAKQK